MQKLFVILFLFPFTLFSKDFYWIGGSGDWSDISHWSTSSGGNATYQTIPGPEDDVYFDENSFESESEVIKITKDAFARSINFTGVLNNPTLEGTASSQLEIYGSLFLSEAMSYNFLGKIVLKGIDENLEIDLAGQKLLGVLRIDATGFYTVLNDIFVDNFFILVNGGIDFNEFDLSCKFLYLRMGSAPIFLDNTTLSVIGSQQDIDTINNSPVAIIKTESSGFSFSNSVLLISGLNAHLQIEGDGNIGIEKISFNNTTGTAKLSNGNIFINPIPLSKVEFSSSAHIENPFSFELLRLNGGSSYTFEKSMTYIIDEIEHISDCNKLTFIRSSDFGTATEFESQNDFDLSYVKLRDVQVVSPSDNIVTEGIDLGGNSGWTFNENMGKDYFWIGGEGEWSDVNNWSLTSGGDPTACLPGPLDNVIFDDNSFTALDQIVNFDLPISHVRSVYWQTQGQNPIFVGNSDHRLIISNSLFLEEEMEHLFEGEYSFLSAEMDNRIRSASQTFYGNLKFEGTGRWEFEDDVHSDNAIFFTSGHLIMSNINAEINQFRSNVLNTRSLDISNSNIRLFEVQDRIPIWEVVNLSMQLNPINSKVEFIGDTKGVFNITQVNNDNQIAYNVVKFNGIDGDMNVKVVSTNTNNLVEIDSVIFEKNGNIIGSARYNVVSFSAGHVYSIDAADNIPGQFIKTIDGVGTCDRGLITLKSNSFTDPADIKIEEDQDLMSYHISDIHFNGLGQINALNSRDGGGNTGVTFQSISANQFYWVGNGGEWQDPMHWSYSSGGSPAGGCVPSSLDNVIFDANSFDLANQVVSSKKGQVRHCNDITWTNTFGNPTFEDSLLVVYGSLIYDDGFENKVKVTELSSNAEVDVEVRGQSFENLLVNGSGFFRFKDDLEMKSYEQKRGESSFENIFMRSERMIIEGLFVEANLKDSEFEITGAASNMPIVSFNNSSVMPLQISSSNVISPGNSIFYLTNEVTGVGGTSLNDFNNMVFTHPSGTAYLNNFSNFNFNKLEFKGSARYFGRYTADTLIGSPGGTHFLSAASYILVTESYQMLGHNCSPITIDANVLPTFENIIILPESEIISDFVRMKNIRSTAFSSHYAGPNSINVYESCIGWTFEELNDEGISLGILGADKIICENDILILDVVPYTEFDSLLWSDGTSGPSISVGEPGNYEVTIFFDSTCVVNDQTTVVASEDIDIGLPEESILCQGSSLSLSPSTNFSNAIFLWNTNETSSSIEVNQEGKYVLNLTSGDCVFVDSTFVLLQENPGLELGEDKIVCEQEEFIIENSNPDLNLEWQDGSMGNSFGGSQGGIYWAEVSIGECVFRDSIMIKELSYPEVDLGVDTLFCANTPFELIANTNTDFDYLWNNESEESIILVESAGEFSVIVSNQGCESSDTLIVNVQFPNEFDLGEDIVVCDGEEVELVIPESGGAFEWENGSMDSVRIVSQAGQYFLTRTDGVCITSDMIGVEYLPVPQLELGSDTTVCNNESFIFRPMLVGEGVLVWSSGETTSSITVTEAGLYEATLSNDGCSVEDEIFIGFRDCIAFEYYIPNAFSPNEDGVNDKFEVFFPDDLLITDFFLEIFDRWGNKVFQSNDLQATWDGTLNGVKTNVADYVYLIEVEYIDDFGVGKTTVSGDVVIMR